MSQILKVDPNASLKIHAKRINQILENGGVIAFPTDTFYGLGVSPFNKKGIRRIFNIKLRESEKPLLVLVSSENQMKQLVKSRSKEANLIINMLWPAPLTLIFDALPEIPDILTAKTGKIGIRLPASEWTRRLIETTGCPLTATSANRNGGTNLRTAQEVLQVFGNKIDLIIDPGPAPGGKVSTLLDTTVSPPVLLRRGAITQQEIESCTANECTLVS